MNSFVRIATTTLAVAGLGVQASANIFPFDPDGTAGPNGSLDVTSFDLLPGNMLIKATGTPANPTFTMYSQAKVGTISGATGELAVTGLNSTFELTATITAGVSLFPVFPGSTNLFNIVIGASTVDFWYDDDSATFADDAAGTGFADGTLIYSSSIDPAVTPPSLLAESGGSFPLDRFGPVGDTYPDVTTARYTGAISAASDAAPVVVDTDFFTGGIAGFFADALVGAPFRAVAPAQEVLGQTPNFATGVNGEIDLLLETDGTLTFIIPEPASLAMLAMGTFLIARRRSHA